VTVVIHPDDLTAISAIVMIGLDDSGKTSIINQLKERKPGYLPPTVTTIGQTYLLMHEKDVKLIFIKGANLARVSLPFADVTIFDLGGRQPTRSRWHCCTYLHYRDVSHP
jgi:GTPase SAR1 family protein